MGATRKLAEYVSRTAYKDISSKAIEQAKLCILDWLGVTLGGSREDIAPILIDFVTAIGGEKQATILGKGIKTSVLNAALVNGAMSHVLDYDDVHPASFSHPTVPLAPAVLAVAEHKKASGADLLTAFALGFEVEARAGAAAGRSHYDIGWHATSTIGHFGAAAGAGKLLNLDADRLVNAFGIAGTQVCGVRQVFGTMCKPFHPGKAAMSGVMAAMLAERGFTSSQEILEGKYGFLDIFTKEPDESKLLAGLEEDYHLYGVGFKGYASCAGTHTTIEALKELSKLNLKADDIEEVQIECAKLNLDAAGQTDPKTGLEGKFSVYHCAALAILKGAADEGQFTDEKVNDPEIVKLRKKVKATVNPEFSLVESKTAVKTKDGKEYTNFVSMPKGMPNNPLSFEEMVQKFKGLATLVIPGSNADRIVELIKTLETVSDVSALVSLCNPV
jgi:2-methylcitrate dehydratase PrpD